MSDSERLASWFFRLNGCATIENFIVHPDAGSGGQRTDVDVLGVRFPHRAELLESGMPLRDHDVFTMSADHRPLIVLAEVKSGQCALNGPWTARQRGNMQRVLRAVGIVPEQEVGPLAESLYDTGAGSTDEFIVKMFAVGAHAPASDVLRTGVVVLTWTSILEFIHQRLTTYLNAKSDHAQWDMLGQDLYRTAREFRNDRGKFIGYWTPRANSTP